MTKKRKRITTAIITAILFVVFLIVELYLIRVLDTKIGNEERTALINTMKSKLNDMEESTLSLEEDSYSDILGRELTEDEINNQKELILRYNIILFNNIGRAIDVRLPDGNWLLDDDSLYVRVNNDKNNPFIFTVDDVGIRNEYRKYTENSYYDYDTTEMIERYRYYELVFDSFYVDDTELIPEKINIYKVECNLDENVDSKDADSIEITLVDTIEYDIRDVSGLDYYESNEDINAYSMRSYALKYLCNGNEGYTAFDCIFNEKCFSLDERKDLLEACWNETYSFQDRDLLGFSKYYFGKEDYSSSYYNGNVTMVVCEEYILYGVYKTQWLYIIIVLLLNTVVALGITAIVVAISNKLRNRELQK